MSKQYPGGLITKTPVTPTSFSAPGVWTMDQQAYWQSINSWPFPRDPYFPYVTMLLHGDGTNGAQNNTFLDSSASPLTITRNGNTTQGTFSPYGSNWSNYFDGDGDGLTSATSSGFAFGTGDFTFEGWYYSLDTGSSLRGMFDTRLTSNSTAGVLLREDSSGFLVYINNTALFTASGRVANTWQHIALVRQSGTVRLYINGVQANSASSSTNMTDNNCRISGFVDTQASPYGYFGYISNARVIKGTCLYPSGTSFTPSTTPLTAISGTSLLTCQSNRFIDTSSNALTLTVNGSPSVQRFSPFSPTTVYSTSVIGGSGYFDGTGDYLTAPSGAAVSGTSAFTIQFWVLMTASQTYSRIVSGATNNITINLSSNGDFDYGKNGVNSIIAANAGSILNAWAHVCVARSASGTARVWVNGTSIGTATDSNSYTAATVYIGATSVPSFYLTGYLSNLQITNTDVYGTSNTTIAVPSAPLSAVSGTSLLLSYTNAGILDNAMMNDLETVGNAQISTSVVKYGTGSMYFDGTGDYLTVPFSPSLNLAGDFTIEFWTYLNSTSDQTFVAKTGNGSAFAWFVQLNSTNLRFYPANNGTTGTPISWAWAPSTGQFYHVAISRSGSSVRAFINGTQIGSTGTNSDNLTSTSGMGIGINLDGNTQALNGYIDDLRITKGVARYTANFTAPTAAFQNG